MKAKMKAEYACKIAKRERNGKVVSVIRIDFTTLSDMKHEFETWIEQLERQEGDH